MAFAWWVNIWVMLRALMAACTGSDSGVVGNAYWGCLAGMSSMWTICGAYVCEVVHILPCTFTACTGAETVRKGA